MECESWSRRRQILDPSGLDDDGEFDQCFANDVRGQGRTRKNEGKKEVFVSELREHC